MTYTYEEMFEEQYGDGPKRLEIDANKIINRPRTTAKNYTQEIVTPYERYILWKDYPNERRLLYAGAELCKRRFGIGVLKERLEWIRKKNCINHIGAFNYLSGNKQLRREKDNRKKT